jgi:hypothetical protein
MRALKLAIRVVWFLIVTYLALIIWGLTDNVILAGLWFGSMVYMTRQLIKGKSNARN